MSIRLDLIAPLGAVTIKITITSIILIKTICVYYLLLLHTSYKYLVSICWMYLYCLLVTCYVYVTVYFNISLGKLLPTSVYLLLFITGLLRFSYRQAYQASLMDKFKFYERSELLGWDWWSGRTFLTLC